MKSRHASSLSTEASSGPAARGQGEIRIIGGVWKRTRLTVPVRPGLRPTPDRVRETLFNWLGQSLGGWRCVDVFAGTGALGLEAASRGAAEVVLCEQDRALVQQLKTHVTRLQATHVNVHAGDGLHWLRQQTGGHWDVVFLDPPYASDLFEPALRAAASAIGPQGWVYLEAPEAWDAQTLSTLGWSLQRHLKAGAVHAHLLQLESVRGAA